MPKPTPVTDSLGVPVCVGDAVLVTQNPGLSPVYTVQSCEPILDSRFPPGAMRLVMEDRLELIVGAGQLPGCFVVGQRAEAPDADVPLLSATLPFPGKKGN